MPEGRGEIEDNKHHMEDEGDIKAQPKYFFEVCSAEQTAELERLRAEIALCSDHFGEEGRGTEHPSTLNLTVKCAELCYLTRKFEEAEMWFRRAWHGYRRALCKPFERTHISVYRAGAHLAKTLSELRRFQESEAIFRESLKGLEDHLGIEHHELIATIDGMAIVFHEVLKLDESEASYRRLHNLHAMVSGPMHPDTLGILNRLAIVLRDANNLPEADRICMESLDNCTIVLGKDHPTTQNSVEIAAYVRHAMGLSEEAEDMFRLAMACNERKLGYDHPSTINTVSRIGQLLSDQGDYEQSEAFHRRALGACLFNYGREHEKTVDEAYYVGVLCLLREEIPEAEELLRWAFTGRQQLYSGSLHPKTMDSAHYLGLLVQKQSLWRHDHRCAARLEEAEYLLRMALQGRDEAPSLGPTHHDSMETCMRLAVFLFEEHRVLESEELWRRVYQSRRKKFGDANLETAEAAYNYGIILQHRRRFDAAAKAMYVAVAGYTAAYGRKEEKKPWEEEDEIKLHPILEDAMKIYENCTKLSM